MVDSYAVLNHLSLTESSAPPSVSDLEDPSTAGIPPSPSAGVSILDGAAPGSASEFPSPSSSPTSTPLLIRKVNIVDEVERKLGRKTKVKKKAFPVGTSH